MVTILGSSWFPAMPAVSSIAFLEYAKHVGVPLPPPERVARMFVPVIGIVLVRVDPAGEQKAYVGVAAGRDQKADEDFIAEWGAHFPVDVARKLIAPIGTERVKGKGRE